MTTIIPEAANEEEVQKVKAFADEDGLRLFQQKPSIADLIKAGYTNGKAAAETLQKMADTGGPTSFGPDASAWQREIRKDKPLVGRE